MKKGLIVLFFVLVGISLFIGCQATYITFAKMYLEQENYEMAIQQTQAAVQENPNSFDAYFYMGQAYGKKHMYQEMNDAYKKCLELSPKYSEQISQDRMTYWVRVFNQGIEDYNENRLDAALNQFKLAVDLQPDNVDSYKNLALIYSRMDNNAAAIEVYENALKADPNEIILQYFIGRLYYYGAKDYEKTIATMKDFSTKADPQTNEYIDALYLIAISYDLMGNTEQAIASYYQALEKVPNDKDILINLGRLYLIQENFPKAIEILEGIVGQDPNDFDANYGLGNAYANIANTYIRETRATDDKGKSVLTEKEIEAKFLEGKTYYEKAIPFLEKATELNPGSQYAWNELGIAYVYSGRPEAESVKVFEIAEVMKSADAMAIIEQNGKPDEVLFSITNNKKVVVLKYLATMASFKFVDRILQK